MATNNNTQILVNGKPMTNEAYLKLLKDAREAQTAYKQTPQYKAEIEARQKLSAKRNELVAKFLEFGKKLGLTNSEIGTICNATYVMTRREENKQ
jgi:hypothetical protein